MEPMLPNPNNNSSTAVGESGLANQIPEQIPVTSPEQSSQPPSLLNSQQVQDDQTTVIQQTTVQADQNSVVTDDQSMPAIADDVDVIEKEWVDKAKKIVNSTKNDPREQEKEVSKLQADYLMKRYGKQVKIAE